jgi:hypothetical protein
MCPGPEVSLRIMPNPALVQSLLVTALPKVAEFAMKEPLPAPAAPVPHAAQSVSVEMLVTLATAEPAIERRRRAAVEADRGLRALERLDMALAAGLPVAEPLREVAAWSATQHAPQDAALAAIYSEIEMRVRIELAKHDITA